MASRELSILVAAKGALKAASDIGKVDSAVGNLGRTATQGVRTAGANIAKIGLVIGGGIAVGVKSGISSLADLEDATTSVQGAINQVGLAGQITAGQVATWANDIERDVQAAFDDKAITAAAATLIRFGGVTADNLQPALQVMTDLAAKTGDVDSAATLLAKVLADPAKAAGKLAKAGVVLTKSQQDEIKAMVKAGKTAEAQAVLLKALEKTTRGAAAASAGPYRDSLNILADVSEDAQRALGEGFLPIITKVADLLSKKLADPKTMTAIRDFGKGLAGGLDQVISLAQKVPWGSIGDAMKLAGAGAKAALDLFTGMPPWVQTAVLTGWGLNKLTGGALGTIVGELGKGLIKGVLGIQAGVVNVTGGVVNGGGGAGLLPAASGAAGAAGAAGSLGLGAIVAGVLGGAAVASGALLLLGKLVEATSTPEQLAQGRRTFNQQQREKHNPTGVTPSKPVIAQDPEERGRSQRAEQSWSAIRASIESTRLAVQHIAVPAPTVNVYVSAHTVTRKQTKVKRAGNTTWLHAQ